ncbi:MAG: gluconate 2-dehydrogenase subunit 3 family protein [Flavobacteriales bacterium]|nr:MAG: gluconate 2-dehydrogenase subunit 3 family protein [Flavobacteriales bacterium]
MDRRKALRNMGLAMGYTIATPTLLSIVQSCKKEVVLSWAPEFFAQDEAIALSQLVDIILPKTDTPSASEMQVDVFIDRFANQAMEPQQKDFMRMAMGKFFDKALKDAGKDKAGDLTSKELEATLAEALKVTKDEKLSNMEAIESYTQAMMEGNETTLEEGISRYAFADNLRQMTIWGYKTSEYVGEEVLAYLPVPGEYIACGDVQELTGGKAWSI